MAKLIIFSAPSGSGKSTIINYLLTQGLDLHFSISATSRSPRGEEKNGVEYYFLSPEKFKALIAAGAFVEYEEVYPNRFYGTLKQEIDRLLSEDKHVVLDVDVAGGMRIKRIYGEQALTVFIKPPSIEELRKRLVNRGTDTSDVINSRVSKAEYEMSFAARYDYVVVNDNLETACQEVLEAVRNFLK